METYITDNEFGIGEVKSWASIIDEQTLEQAQRTSRSPAISGHVALMPDAHLGLGATVGSVIRTEGRIIPAAVGVDIGCGMIAVRTSLERARLTEQECRHIAGRIREGIPSGFGKGQAEIQSEARAFVQNYGWAPGVEGQPELKQRAMSQFCSLGDGNHFAEVAEDEEGYVWAIVHSGSRGVGNVLAVHHTKLARHICEAAGVKLEDPDLSWLAAGQPEFDAYIADMRWAQEYAYWQREAMMTRVLDAINSQIPAVGHQTINCHHNYAEEIEPGVWLTRKGAIDASPMRLGIIPGSMGAATYVVVGLGNAEAYHSSPHGAGRVYSRGRARRELDVEAFKGQMAGRVWQDRDADALLDEAPDAYKSIEQVIADSATLVEPQAVLRQFINYKGVGKPRRGRRADPAVAVAEGDAA